MTLKEFEKIWPAILIIVILITIELILIIRMAYKIGQKSITKGGIISTIASCILLIVFWPATIIPPIIYAAYKAGTKRRNSAMPDDLNPRNRDRGRN